MEAGNDRIFDTTILFDVDLRDPEKRKQLEAIGKEFVEYAKKRLEEAGAVYKIHGGKIRRAYRSEVLFNSRYIPKKKHWPHEQNVDSLCYHRNRTFCDYYAKVENIVRDRALVNCKRCQLRLTAQDEKEAKDKEKKDGAPQDPHGHVQDT